MIKSGNKIIISDDGKIFEPYTLPKIELTTRRPAIPYYLTDNYGSGVWRITSSVLNVMYIDFGDGSEIYEREFSGTIDIRTNSPIHTYTDGITEHKIKVWFKFPNKITQFYSHLCEWWGEFPNALSLYSLDSLTISSSLRFNDFPTDFGASVLNILRLSEVTANVINDVPLWITKSRIRTIYLGGRINLSNNTTNNVDKLINVQGLYSLTFLGGNLLTDVSSNFKDITTLRYLAIGGGNPTTSITTNINACKQIQHLSFGYTSNSNFGSSVSDGQLNSWGVGLVGMSNLIGLYYGGCLSAPTDAIIGLNDAVNLKTIYARSSYTTVVRMDTFITNLYNQVITIASMTLGNTIMRQVRLEVCWVNGTAGVSKRPTGVYQMPTGYVQGSDNGTPASPMEMLYVLVKQYRWTILIPNTTENGIETLTP